MNPDKARELMEARRQEEQNTILKIEKKIEDHAKLGLDNVLIKFKTSKGTSEWRTQWSYERFKERGFDCHFEHTNSFRIKW